MFLKDIYKKILCVFISADYRIINGLKMYGFTVGLFIEHHANICQFADVVLD